MEIPEKPITKLRNEWRRAQYALEKQNTVLAFENAVNIEYKFPPEPLNDVLAHNIIEGACKKMRVKNFEEAGCAVCGQLVPLSSLSRLKHVKKFLHILTAQGVTHVERKKATAKIKEFSGPVLDYKCNKICDKCCGSIRKGQVPT